MNLKKLNYSITLLILLNLTTFSLWSVKIDEEELKKVSEKIEFRNNKQIPGKGDSLKEIRNIGRIMSKGIEQNQSQGKYGAKYRLLRALDTESPKLSADIFIIERTARVDHIDNVRRILSSYIQSSYKYDKSDADTLALFATYYNAVYRSDLEYFKTTYHDGVTKNLSAANAGIAKDYREWPGKTRMIIPIENGRVSTETVGDKKVKEELKKQPDKGIPEREKLVKIEKKDQEKEKTAIKEEKKKVEEKKEEIRKKEDDLTKKKEESDKKAEEIKRKEEELARKKKDAEQEKDPVKKKEKEEEVKKREEELAKEKEKKKQEDEAAEKERKKLEDEKKEAEKKEAELKKREEDAKKDAERLKKEEEELRKDKDPEAYREELERRERELKKREEDLAKNPKQKNVFDNKIYYLKTIEYTAGGKYKNNMMIIDPATKKVELISPYRNISGRKFDTYANGVVVIGQEGKRGFVADANYLVLLDLETLEPVHISEDNVFWRSFIEIRDDFIFAIIRENNEFYLAKFDKTMSRVARSETPVHEDTFISFFNDDVFVNNKQKEVVILNKSDLKQSGTIKP
ncbi:MAG: hypothetical protein KDK41_09090 [Leptospiraceae bacterium]|nr:hypothetical protein [Leptospiraceae bacterium]